MNLKYVDALPYDLKYKILKEFVDDYNYEQKVFLEFENVSTILMYNEVDRLIKKHNIMYRTTLYIKIKDYLRQRRHYYVIKCLETILRRG